MSKAAKYFGREGNPLTRAEWEVHRLDRSYWCVREYDNGAVFLRLIWMGLVIDPVNTWPDCWPIFKLEVGNYDSVGVLRKDPIMSGKTFAAEDEAVSAYEEFLKTWTNSHEGEDGFVEEDNAYTPPPPPDLDAPMTETANIKLGIMDDGVGAW